MAMEAAETPFAPGLPRNVTAQGTWASAYVRTAEVRKFSVFSPSLDVNTPATRGAVVQTILEVLGFPVGKTTATFSDVPASHPYSNAIAVAAFYGLVSGDDGKNTFRPDAPMNRAEAAKIVALATGLFGK